MEQVIAELDFEGDFFAALLAVFVAWDYFISHPSDLAMTRSGHLESDPRARTAVRQNEHHGRHGPGS